MGGFFSFHAAILIILLGAGVTRYFGYEGMIHIREGDTANHFLSFDDYLVFEVRKNGKTYSFEEPVLFASLGNNHFEESYLLGNREINVEVLDFLPNPKETLVPDELGVPIIKIVIGGANGREEYYLEKGKRARIRGTLFNFRDMEEPLGFNIKYENGNLSFKAPQTFTQTIMATQEKTSLEAEQLHLLRLRSLYSDGNRSFVFGDFSPSARVELISTDQKMTSKSMAGVKLRVSCNGENEEQYVFGSKGIAGRPRVFTVGDMSISISYGAKKIHLPFSLALRDFILEKYPGTNSASSYASEVTLIDPRTQLREDFTNLYE